MEICSQLLLKQNDAKEARDRKGKESERKRIESAGKESNEDNYFSARRTERGEADDEKGCHGFAKQCLSSLFLLFLYRVV